MPVIYILTTDRVHVYIYKLIPQIETNSRKYNGNCKRLPFVEELHVIQ